MGIISHPWMKSWEVESKVAIFGLPKESMVSFVVWKRSIVCHLTFFVSRKFYIGLLCIVSLKFFSKRKGIMQDECKRKIMGEKIEEAGGHVLIKIKKDIRFT